MSLNQPIILKFRVKDLDSNERASFLIEKLKALPGVTQVDLNFEKKLIRLVSASPLSINFLQDSVRSDNFFLIPFDTAPQNASSQSAVFKVGIDGMTCQSCEITVERKFKNLTGVKNVNVNAAKGVAIITCQQDSKPRLEDLQAAIVDDGYKVRGVRAGIASPAKSRPSLIQLIVLFAIVLFLGAIFSRFGLLKPNVALGSSTTFFSAFLIGLVAASSSCLAVAGGLLLSSVSKFNQRYGGQGLTHKMTPVFLFVSGRVASYGVLGGVIGILGKAVAPSPLVTGLITLVAAVYMLIMGLDMLHLAPAWLKGLMPRMPKSLSHKVLDAQGKVHPLAPLGLGAATFFLPCGFTQALQLYALTTGSFWASAALLFAFALGTAPALIALGLASSSFKGKLGQYFFRFSGALVIVLGLWNIQNGFTIAGYPLSLPKLNWSDSTSAAGTDTAATDPNVSYDGKKQVVKISVGYQGYSPNKITLRQGVPTRLEVDGTDAGGCLSVFQIPKLKIRQYIKSDNSNVIEFTPTETGPITFSCSMGMYRGQINVVPSSS